MDEKQDNKCNDRAKDKDLASRMINQTKNEIVDEENKYKNYVEKLIHNKEELEEQIH